MNLALPGTETTDRMDAMEGEYCMDPVPERKPTPTNS